MTKKKFTEKVFKVIKASSNNELITLNSKLKEAHLTGCDKNEIEVSIDELIGYNTLFSLSSEKTIKENIDEAFTIYVKYNMNDINEQIINLIESNISDLVDSITNKEKQIKRLEELKVIISDSILDQQEQ